MRLRYALVVLLFTTPFIVAQEEPLPAVTPKTAFLPEVMLIATAVEPARELRTPTLAEAARLNDYQTFDTLYREAIQRGESVAQFATLHELWTYAMTNPIGSFYDQEMYERLARAYPGYAAFIDEHRIVDSRGNVFYPTSETRRFVLERAMEGRGPRVLVASDDPAPTKPKAAVAAVQPAAGLRARPSRETVTAAPPAPSSSLERQALSPSAPVVAAVQPAPGLRARPSRETVTTAPPAPSSSLERRALSPSAPVVVAEVPATAPVVETAAPAPVQQPVAPVQPAGASSARGLLLIVIGLLGVGLLAVMFRTPQETMPPIIEVEPQETSAAPVAPVEPLKRPEAQESAPKNRATGSRG